MRKIISVALLILFGITNTANAQVKDKSYKDWTVYMVTMQGKKTCYIASFPKAKSGNFHKRDEPYLMVTYLGDDVAEVSTSSGYKYKEGSTVNVTGGNKKLTMFTAGELAWANDRNADKEFVSVMKKEKLIRVKGSSTVGTYSIDKYSLNGFSDAYNRMKEACK